MKVKIYKPTKSAMQSGKAKNKWLIEFLEKENIRHQSELMKWTSVDNTMSQLKFEFSSKDEAINFAKANNFSYELVEPNKSTLKKKAYADNFTS